jgi:hypothetical protein
MRKKRRLKKEKIVHFTRVLDEFFAILFFAQSAAAHFMISSLMHDECVSMLNCQEERPPPNGWNVGRGLPE